jgi:hypothetical protein
MVEPGEQVGEGQEDRYAYFRGLPLEEIQEHLEGLSGTFDDIRGHYSGPIGRHRKKIKDEDMDALMDAFGDLLPMSLNTAVQQEFGEGKDPEDLAHTRIIGLTQDVLLFAARFENTGITAFPLEQQQAD